MQIHLRRVRQTWLAASFIMAAGVAPAQPNVVKLVVPFPAGGVTDQAARILAEKMSQQLGQTMVVENRPGAGSRLGVDAVVKAPADGATLLFTNSSYSILPVVDPKVLFNPTRALAPVSLSATYGLQIVTSNKIPVDSLAEFITYAKKNPGKLSYGSAGVGSGTHFAGEYFKAKWSRRSVRAFYDRIRNTMPPGAPGSLPSDTYADIVAYILGVNGFKPGSAALKPGDEALNRMELK